ncbi:hypothetical protein SBRCBS47491_008356 [Sporothrix bragantina]|uniref:Uncharacterized protein n=1 Tax=Sporothrix bragantina TaxID=671064 RepID=A0ABP0CKR5_9PEZI
MMFWPSAVLASFPGFIISSFVVGFGLGILETAANPFIALCGPMEYSEMRLLITQGAQGVGSVLSGLLAQNVFFVNVGASGTVNSTTLLDVQWTYLSITLFCVILALFFYYMPLPELHDAELELAASHLPVDGGATTGSAGVELRGISSGSSVFHMATSSVHPDDESDHPAGLAISVPNYLQIARTAFAISRFFTAYIVYLGVKYPKNRWLPTPRTILTMSTSLMTLFALLIVVLKPSQNANLIMIPVTLYFLAEGPVWPLVFAIGLRGQGTRTKRAAAYITMGASGPLFWPFVMYAIMKDGGTIQIAFVIVVALMAVSTVYPLFLTFVRDARDLTKVAPLDPRQGSGADDSQAGQPRLNRPAAPRPGVLDMSMLGGTHYSVDEHYAGEQQGENDHQGEQNKESKQVSNESAPTSTTAPGPSSQREDGTQTPRASTMPKHFEEIVGTP